MSTKPHTIVVGGGVAGLSAAARLTQAGHRTTILEAAKMGGGRARSFNDNVVGREIDNGQHLMMGCYRETHRFLRRIGVEPRTEISYQKNLELIMRHPGGSEVAFRCPALPAPLHLAAGLLGMPGVSLLGKVPLLQVGRKIRSEVANPDDNESCDAWLRRLRQPKQLRNVFWDPMIWSVLNEDPLVASAKMMLAVVERAFMSTRDASCLAAPRRPLGSLYVEPAAKFLQDQGSEYRLNTRVRSIDVELGRAIGVTLKDGSDLRADNVITAVPHFSLLPLLDDTIRRDRVFRRIEKLKDSPILNLWINLDRPLFTQQPYVGLIGSPLHWLFDRDAIEGRRRGATSLLTATVSGARKLINDTDGDLQQLFEREAKRYFPTNPVRVTSMRVIKEKRATLTHAVGTYDNRPDTISPIKNLYLAGDWVKTGLPATIESAADSGHRAARAILGD